MMQALVSRRTAEAELDRKSEWLGEGGFGVLIPETRAAGDGRNDLVDSVSRDPGWAPQYPDATMTLTLVDARPISGALH